jgi:hypothetical protein
MQLYKSFLLLLSTSITAVSGSLQHIRHGKLGREELLRKRRGLAPAARKQVAVSSLLSSCVGKRKFDEEADMYNAVDRMNVTSNQNDDLLRKAIVQKMRGPEHAHRWMNLLHIVRDCGDGNLNEYLQNILSGQIGGSQPTWILLKWLMDITIGGDNHLQKRICGSNYTVVQYSNCNLPSEISPSITRFLINFRGQKMANFLLKELYHRTNGTMSLSKVEKLSDEDITLNWLSKIKAGEISIDAKHFGSCYGQNKLDILEYVKSNSCGFIPRTKNKVSQILTPFFEIFQIPPQESASMEESV